MRIWKRFSRVFVLLALIVTGGGFVVWNWLYPAKYKAQARLLVRQEVPRVLFRTVETDSRVNDYRRYQVTQMTLVKSRIVLNAALLDPTVSKYRLQKELDPIAWLRHALIVEFVAGSEVMEIALRGDDPVELAGLVNAVTKAYMEEVVNFEIKRRLDRHAHLKKIKQTYADIIKEKRQILRRLSSSDGGGEDRTTGAIETSPRNYLWTQRVQLRLERAEAETLLARRKKSAAAKIDPVRQDIAQLEDRLAVVTARQTVLDEEGKELIHALLQDATIQTLDLKEIENDIALLEDASRKVGAEIEALNVELEAPARIRVIEEAVPPTTRFRASSGGSLANGRL